MRGKNWRRWLCLCVVFVMLSIALGAAPGKPQGEVSIKAAPATVKYRRDEEITHYYMDGVAHIEAAKNEYEAVQIIMTAEREVSYFDAAVSALVHENGDVLARENVSLFYEHYVNVYKQTNSAYPTGYYPDAIIPLENVVRAGENRIEKGHNQALWLRVFVPEDAEPGVYTGSVTLVLDGKEQICPVRLLVYDLDITRENHNKTAFNTWGVNGDYREVNANGHLYSNTALYKKYYDMLKEYRIAASEIPTLDLLEPDTFSQTLVEYARDPMVSSYNIPSTTDYVVKNGTGYGVLNTEDMEETLRAMLDVSISENLDMFAKAFLYIPYLDEPHEDKYWAVIQSSEDFELLRVRLCEEYRAQHEGDAFVETLLESLMAVPNLITIIDVSRISQLEGYVDAWCPIADNWQSAESEIFLENRIEQGDKMWWYTCNTPKNPYPSYHVDDALIGSRLLSWMQMNKNVSGNLYWCTNLYGYSDWGETIPRDVWEDPLAWLTAAGDGYLCYPGLKYGIDGPLATIRLESIRDGMEEYEYLYLLDELLTELSEKYELNVGVNEYVSNLYDRLFANMVPFPDPFEVLNAKRELASLITAFQDENFEAYVGVEGINVNTSCATATVIAKPGTQVKANGVLLENGRARGEGVEYSVQVPLTGVRNTVEFELTRGGETISVTRVVGGLSSCVNACNTAAEISETKSTEDIKLSLCTDAAFRTEGAGSLKCEIAGKPELGLSYVPTLVFEREEGFSVAGYGEFSFFEFDVYNAGDAYVKFGFSTDEKVAIGTAYVPPKSWKRIKIRVSGDVTKETKKVYLETDNTTAESGGWLLYFDNIGFSFR